MLARLQLLGSPTIDWDGTTVALPFERRTQLLVLLALRGGWIGRAEIAALLWPEAGSTLALTHLRKALFRLRSLPWAGCVQAQGGSLRVDAETDVRRFEQALRDQRPADALALHTGVLLAGFDDDANEAWTGWLQFERARVQSAWRAAALAWLEAGAAGDRADGAQALQLSARLLEADPLDEAALRLHMALLAEAGQAARARQAYREFASRMTDELGITPGPELQALHDALGLAPAAADGEPARAEPAAAAATSDDPGFVGRTVERRRIAEMLTGDSVRLLSITGPGGTGKTRLAQRALLDLAAAFADGAHFVALEDVSGGDELAQRIARDAGLALQGRDPPLQQLAQALGARSMLLVLDNFEQLAAEAPALQTLLAACPRLRLLVTSRVRLGLAAEQLLPLEGLPCPEPEDVDRFAAFDAARLFVSAAQRVDPGLVAASEAAAIVDICRQVEGLPLALELAAAWTRVLSCEAIAAELRAGASLLHAQGAGHPARHASIEQVFEQSWRHLVPAERDALARLSVFQGGFTADAARAVTGCALPVLGTLADKSLLRKEGARLSLHALVQQFAAARLVDTDRAATQAAHAAYFYRVLAQLRPAVDRGERAALLAVDSELQNIRLAWDWVIAQGQGDRARSIAAALHGYFDHRGRFETVLQLFNQALEAPRLQGDGPLRAWLRGEAAQALYRLDRYAEAEAAAQAAIDAADRHTETAVQLRANTVLATCALRTGRLDDARRWFERVHALAAAQDDGRHAAAALDHLALVEKRLGNYGDALRLSLDALARHRAMGDHARTAMCLTNLASLYQSRGDPAAAAPHLQEALAICKRDGLTGTMAYVLANLVEVTLKLGAVAEAALHAEHAIEVAEASGNRAICAWVQTQQARLSVRRGDMASAAITLAAALSRAREMSLPTVQAVALMCFAELLHATDDIESAQRVLSLGAAHPSMSAPDRDEMRSLLAHWGASADAAAETMPAIDFDELLHRIVVEAPDGHAALRALLRRAPAASSPG